MPRLSPWFTVTQHPWSGFSRGQVVPPLLQGNTKEVWAPLLEPQAALSPSKPHLPHLLPFCLDFGTCFPARELACCTALWKLAGVDNTTRHR
jgi:hypothetical protein